MGRPCLSFCVPLSFKAPDSYLDLKNSADALSILYFCYRRVLVLPYPPCLASIKHHQKVLFEMVTRKGTVLLLTYKDKETQVWTMTSCSNSLEIFVYLQFNKMFYLSIYRLLFHYPIIKKITFYLVNPHHCGCLAVGLSAALLSPHLFQWKWQLRETRNNVYTMYVDISLPSASTKTSW